MTDTLGLLLDVVVHPANVQDRDGARLVLARLRGRFPRLERIWADAGYSGSLAYWASAFGGWTLDIVRKRAGQRTFVVLPRRSRRGAHLCLAGALSPLEQGLRSHSHEQ